MISRASQRRWWLVWLLAVGAQFAGCSEWTGLATLVDAPDLSPPLVSELPADFGEEILIFVLWERFEYVYGEGGIRSLGFEIAPPRILERAELDRLSRRTKSYSYTNKIMKDGDEGTWERGHRARGLVLISSGGLVERFVARDDRPRDPTVTWWPHSSGRLSARSADDMAESMRCQALSEGSADCSLGVYEELLDQHVLEDVEPAQPVSLELPSSDDRLRQATDYLRRVARNLSPPGALAPDDQGPRS